MNTKIFKNNYLTVILSTYILLLGCTESKKNTFWYSKQAYLRQEFPDSVPKIFAPGQLVTSGIVLGRLAFSPDGKEVYYTYAAHWFDASNSGVKRRVFTNGQWQQPEIVGESISNPTFSMDGQTLYFGHSGGTVWAADRQGGGWSEPHPYLEKPYGLYNYMPTLSGTAYMGSNGHTGSKEDYASYDFSTFKIQDKDTVVQSLGAPLNTPGFDGDLYVAPDESYMIISAEETPTYECKLHITFRQEDGSWSPSKSIDPQINKGLAHRFGQYVSPDGRFLFYTQGTSEEDNHIYWVRWDQLLEKLRGD